MSGKWDTRHQHIDKPLVYLGVDFRSKPGIKNPVDIGKTGTGGKKK